MSDTQPEVIFDLADPLAKGYNPMEPRVPKGSPHAGEWTKSGGPPAEGKPKPKYQLFNPNAGTGEAKRRAAGPNDLHPAEAKQLADQLVKATQAERKAGKQVWTVHAHGHGYCILNERGDWPKDLPPVMNPAQLVAAAAKIPELAERLKRRAYSGPGQKPIPESAAFSHQHAGHHGAPKKDAEAKPYVPPPPTSKDLFYDHKTRRWDDKRFALHQSIIDGMLQPEAPEGLAALYDEHDQGPPALAILVGGPGAGKSTYAKKHLLGHHRFAYVDSDGAKEHLPEYDPKSPFHVHKESVEIAQRALKRAIDEGRSVIYDSTGLDVYTIKRAAKRARDAGYHIAVHYVKADPEVAMRRIEHRERKVPKDVVISKHAEVDWAFRQLRDVADFVVEFDNSEDEPHG